LLAAAAKGTFTMCIAVHIIYCIAGM